MSMTQDNQIINKNYPEFDKKFFPVIYVNFKKSIDDESFKYFTNQWLECYKYGKDFTFVFNCQEIAWFNPKYCYRLAQFMKNLRKKKEELPYLKTSIVILQNSFIRKLVNLVFSLQPPQSHVYLAPDMTHATGILRGNQDFIQNCSSIPPDTKITLQQSDKLSQEQLKQMEKNAH